MANKNQSRNKIAYLEKHGVDVIHNGFLIHPLKPFQKGIFEGGWQSVRASVEQLQTWLDAGRGNDGISILTRKTPAVDIDVMLPELAEAMREYVENEFGIGLCRVGKAPKLALVFRTNKPFTKVQSRTFEDWEGGQHKVEILGDGQQLVAFNTHPDTGKPYVWEGKTPADTRADSLPLLTRENAVAIVHRFEDLAEEYGLTPKKNSRSQTGGYTDESLDEDELALLNYRAPRADVSDEDIESALEALADQADDYDTWFKVGMALFHQYGGSQKGFTLWDEWSQNADNYGDVSEAKWESFKDSGNSTPVTVGTLLALANDAKKDSRWELFNGFRESIKNADDARVLMDEVVPEIREHYLDIDSNQQRAIADDVKKRLSVLGMSIPIDQVRKSIRPKTKVTRVMQPEEVLARHPWLEGWAWSDDDDAFVHPLHGKISERSFNKKYERELDIISNEEEALQYVHLERHLSRVFEPSFFATYVADVPKVRGQVYIPVNEPIVYVDGNPFINKYMTWQDRDIVPEKKWSKKQRKAVEALKWLVLSICGGKEHEFEQRIVLSWLADKMQNPKRKSRYALFLVGPKGSGKSSLYMTLVSILGLRNVGSVDPVEIESNFTGWAAQGCFSFVDEIDLSTRRDKERIAQRLRPHISETLVRKINKGQDGRRTLNYCDYIFASNRIDGLPVDEGERRLLVLLSEFNNREEARAAMVDSGWRKTYETYLEDEDCVEAMFSFLMTYEPCAEFNPNDPPETDAKREATESGRSALSMEISDIIETSGEICIAPDIVSISHLRDAIISRSATTSTDIDPKTNRNIIGRVLSEPPFDLVKTTRIRVDGEQYRIRYNPSRWSEDAAKVEFTKRLEKSQFDDLDDAADWDA